MKEKNNLIPGSGRPESNVRIRFLNLETIVSQNQKAAGVWMCLPEPAARMAAVLCAAAMLLLSAGTTVAPSLVWAEEGAVITDEATVTNTVETGVIDISLSLSSEDENGSRQAPLADAELLPGKQVSFIPTITNDGHACYVRIRLSAAVYDEEGALLDIAAPLSADNLYGVQDDWIRAGDYLYDTKPLENGESEEVFAGFVFPADIGNEYAGATIAVYVIAEAVQSDFFTPDFTSNEPWGSLETEECIRKGYLFASLRAGTDASIGVTYVGGAEQFVIVPDDFFAHFGAMMPGGSYTDTVKVSNAYSENTALFFKTGVSEAENALSDALLITIAQINADGTEKNLYEGAYSAESLQSYMPLGVYAEGESCEIRFTITVPESLQNEYTLLDGSTEWYFMAKTTEASDSTSTEEVSDVAPDSSVVDAGIDADVVSGSAGEYQTGDAAQLLLYTLTAAFAGGVIICMFLVRQKKSRKKAWREKQGEGSR